MSENIDVTSVVGRFLEHPRIYWFCNNGADELYMGSADMMPRNLNRRVEVLTPVLDKELRDYLRNTVLKLHLKDTVQCYIMLADGEYLRIKPGKKDKLVNSQESLIELYSASQK